MNIVRLALRRPITLMVIVIAIILAAFMAVVKMPRDILPTLGIPTIYVVQPYGGMSPAQMQNYFTYYYEYHFLYISGIQHMESRNVESAALMKLQFYPGTDMAGALAETVSYVSRARAFMPPGTVAPFVMRFDSGGMPVGDLVFSSKTRTLGDLQDLALNQVRPLFATLKGVSAPPPFGASARTIVVNVDPRKTAKYSLAPDEVARAIVNSNVVLPAGNIPVGNFWPIVPMNAVVKDIHSLLDVPIRLGTVPTIYLRDVGTVQNGTDIPTSYALVNGRRTVYIPVTKSADASTLAVVDLVKANIPRFQAVLPRDVKVTYEFDQSVYVRQSIRSLIFEGMIGAILTGLMVLLFLGDVRSVVIVVVNIPLSLMVSLFALWLTGSTVNVMTLGGLALAVGILVDETTVTIENIHTHLSQGKSIARAAMDATLEILKPSLLILLCVLAVFVPSFFMTGVAKAMFVPLTLAVGFAMIGSFLLSKTLVPVLAVWLLKAEKEKERSPRKKRGVFGRWNFSFDRFRERYGTVLGHLMRHRKWSVAGYLLIAIGGSVFLLMNVGREIFPIVNQGQLKMRVRGPTGTSLDAMEKITQGVLGLINTTVGKDKIHKTLAFVGQQPAEYAINNIYQWSAGTQDSVIQVALKKDSGIRVEELQEVLRGKIHQWMPSLKLTFEPSSLIDSAMSQGTSTPIEISVNGPDLPKDHQFARSLMKEISGLGYLRDLQFGQVFNFPSIKVEVSRPEAGLMGLDIAGIGKTLVPATSSTRFTIPNFWVEPRTGINYQVQVMVPQGRITSVDQLRSLPVGVNGGAIPLHRFAKVFNDHEIGEYDQYDMQSMITIIANLYGKDLGHAAQEIEARLRGLVKKSPRGIEVHYRGQIQSLTEMLTGLSLGLALAIVVIFLFLAGNFESFTLALSILVTVPAVLTGSLLVLYLTGTTLNIESFMGTIMAIGIAVSNSILLVTFAEKDRIEGSGDAVAAAIEGARSRLRPILMTSSAMLIGMVPMAMGWSDGGKQTSPLGRAVMGGLGGATLTTLLILPQIFALIQGRRSRRSASLDPDDPRGRRYEGDPGEIHPNGGGSERPEEAA